MQFCLMMLQPTHQMLLWLSPVLDASPPDKIRQPSTGKRSNRPLPVVKSSLASRRRLLKAAVECKEKFRRSHLSGDTRESLCWEGDAPSLHQSPETAGISSAETDTAPHCSGHQLLTVHPLMVNAALWGWTCSVGPWQSPVYAPRPLFFPQH